MKALQSTVLFLALASAFSANATHIVGGELTYEYLGNSLYEITVIMYRDCGPDNVNLTGFDDPAYVGVYENNNLVQSLSIPLSTATVSQIPYGIEDDCLVLPPDVCIEQCIYITTVTLVQNATGYDIVYIRCCRSPAIINLNIPEDQGMTCHTRIPGTNQTSGANNSARFTNLPPALFCTNEAFYMDHSATDADGDALTYEFCMPLLGADAFVPQPTPYATWVPLPVNWAAGYNDQYPIESSPAFAINPNTGALSGTPILPGKYVYAICATEWRDGLAINIIKRDYMIQVLPCQEVYVAAIPQIEPCIGMTIIFNNNSQSADEFLWDFGVVDTNADTTSLFEPEYTFADTGLYTITLIAEPGATCSDTATQIIAVYPPLEGEIALTDSYCEDGQMWFDFNVSGNYDSEATFFWDFPTGSNPESSTDENPPPFGNSNTGTATVQLNILNHNCEIDFSQQVDIPQLPDVDIDVSSEPCTGSEIAFSNTSQFCSTGVWDFGLPGNDDTSTDFEPVFIYPEYGTFNVTYTCSNDEGCSDSETIAVLVSDDDPLEMQYTVSEPLACAGETQFVFTFTGEGTTSLLWDFGDDLTSDAVQATHVYEEEDTYTVTLTIYNDICGVLETEVFDVEYSSYIPTLDLKMPNIMSPNNDNKNELLVPFDPNEEILTDGSSIFEFFEFFSLKVYDRWGLLMFESSGNQPWDGRFNGDDVSAGVYYYIVQYRVLCNTETISHEGYVHVVREK